MKKDKSPLFHERQKLKKYIVEDRKHETSIL